MKKIYEKPVMNIITMNLESMIAASPDSIKMGAASYDGEAKIESNERRGIFSNDDAPSYNRNLW